MHADMRRRVRWWWPLTSHETALNRKVLNLQSKKKRAAAGDGVGAAATSGAGSKSLVRRKSELPQDLYTAKALANYKRPEDHLTTNAENS